MPHPPVHRRRRSFGVRRHGGFTLIELLLTVTLCGLLLGFGVIANRAINGGDTIATIALAGDGRSAAAVFRDGTVKAWETGSGVQTLSVVSPELMEFPECAIVRGGSILLLSDDNHGAPFGWSLSDGTPIDWMKVVFPPPHEGYMIPTASVPWTADGMMCFYNSSVGVDLRNPWRGYGLRLLTDLRTPVEAVAMPMGAGMLAAGYANGRIELWNVASQTVTETLTAAPQTLVQMVFSPDGAKLVTHGRSLDQPLGAPGFITIWDLSQDPPSASALATQIDLGDSMVISSDNRVLAIAGSNGIERWNIQDGNRLDTIPVEIQQFEATPDGRYWLVEGRDSLTLWDGAIGKPIRTLWRSRESLNMGIICFGFFATIISWAMVRAGQLRRAVNSVADRPDAADAEAVPVTEPTAREPDLPPPPDA